MSPQRKHRFIPVWMISNSIYQSIRILEFTDNAHTVVLTVKDVREIQNGIDSKLKYKKLLPLCSERVTYGGAMRRSN